MSWETLKNILDNHFERVSNDPNIPQVIKEQVVTIVPKFSIGGNIPYPEPIKEVKND